MVDNTMFKKESEVIDFASLTYKDIKILGTFLSDQGKILPRRATGVTVQQQRKLAKAIKRARVKYRSVIQM